MFSLFYFSQVWKFRVNSLQLVLEPRVRFEWKQWQRKQEISIWNRKVRWHRLWILDDANRGLFLWEEVASAASREKPATMKDEEWALFDKQVLRVIRLTLSKSVAHNV